MYEDKTGIALFLSADSKHVSSSPRSSRSFRRAASSNRFWVTLRAGDDGEKLFTRGVNPRVVKIRDWRLSGVAAGGREDVMRGTGLLHDCWTAYFMVAMLGQIVEANTCAELRLSLSLIDPDLYYKSTVIKLCNDL